MHNERPLHIDEITVWSWVAITAFALIALAAVLLGTSANVRMASDVETPALPLTAPTLVPPDIVTDPRA